MSARRDAGEDDQRVADNQRRQNGYCQIMSELLQLDPPVHLTNAIRRLFRIPTRQKLHYFHRTATASRVVVFTIALDARTCRHANVFQSDRAIFHSITDVLGRNSSAPAHKLIIRSSQHIFCIRVHWQLSKEM